MIQTNETTVLVVELAAQVSVAVQKPMTDEAAAQAVPAHTRARAQRRRSNPIGCAAPGPSTVGARRSEHQEGSEDPPQELRNETMNHHPEPRCTPSTIMRAAPDIAAPERHGVNGTENARTQDHGFLRTAFRLLRPRGNASTLRPGAPGGRGPA